MKRFLTVYGPNAQIRCCACHKASRMVPALNGEITRREIAYYRRIHVCRPPTEPWDLEQEGGAS